MMRDGMACSNCRYNLKLKKYDYSKGGCEHTEMEGFACMAFAPEGDAIWMVGGDPDNDLCEEWAPRRNDGDTV